MQLKIDGDLKSSKCAKLTCFCLISISVIFFSFFMLIIFCVLSSVTIHIRVQKEQFRNITGIDMGLFFFFLKAPHL